MLQNITLTLHCPKGSSLATRRGQLASIVPNSARSAEQKMESATRISQGYKNTSQSESSDPATFRLAPAGDVPAGGETDEAHGGISTGAVIGISVLVASVLLSVIGVSAVITTKRYRKRDGGKSTIADAKRIDMPVTKAVETSIQTCPPVMAKEACISAAIDSTSEPSVITHDTPAIPFMWPSPVTSFSSGGQSISDALSSRTASPSDQSKTVRVSIESQTVQITP